MVARLPLSSGLPCCRIIIYRPAAAAVASCCRRALRGVVARAQAANDERLLANPYLQLRAMLDLGRIQLHGDSADEPL